MLHITLKGMEVAHILSLHTLSTPRWCQKVKTFFLLKEVMLHIKLKVLEHRAPCEHIFCPYKQPRPPGWGQKVKTFFSENTHVACQNKGNEAYSSMQAHILSFNSHPQPPGGVKRSNLFFLEVVMLHIKLKGMEYRAPCKHIFCPYTHPLPLVLGQKVIFF